MVSIISGDKLEDLEEANPFSFKEFLKTKNLSLSKEDTTNSRVYPKVHLSGKLSVAALDSISSKAQLWRQMFEYREQNRTAGGEAGGSSCSAPLCKLSIKKAERRLVGRSVCLHCF